jgi:transcriptional regulator with XRE-family HTH domain
MTGRSPSKALSDPSDLEPSPATLLIASLPDLPAAVETAEETPPGSVSTLTRARQERTLTLSEAAKATRIWECDLQALERDAPLEEFPAPAYARFFLREYAEYLGLDPAVVVNEFDERHPVREEPAFEPLPDPRPRRRIIAIALAVVSVVSLAGIALLPLGSGPKAEPTPIASAGVPEGIPGHALATRHPAGPTLRGVRAVLRLSEPCWIRAVADGRALARATLQPGGPVVYRAGHLLTLVLGNAGAADLRVNGRPIATGDLGQVMRFEFRWRHDRLFSKIV